MKILNKSKINYILKIIWIYTKYQLLTKTLLFFVIFPIFKISMKKLIVSSGRIAISSGDYIDFLFSIQGFGLLIISLFILALLIGLDINAFIIMSALIKENRIKLSARQLLIVGIKSLKSILKPSGIFIILYVVLIVPIVGVGLTVSISENFEIPNFITDVIFNNPLYLSIYSLIIILLSTLTFIYSFFFHYLIIDNRDIGESLKKSYNLMKKNWKEFIKKFVIKIGIIYILFLILASIFTHIFLLYFQTIDNIFFRRLLTIFISISSLEILEYISIMTIPFICYKLTELFYVFNEKDNYEIKLKQKVKAEYFENDSKIKISTKISIIFFLLTVFLFNLLVSIFLSIFFEDIFRVKKNIEIIAHRGGGNLAAENSILGMEKALNQGAKWSEIDVQRTKDGYYIINHDTTFYRVSGSKKKSTELTLNEIKKLKINDLFNVDGEAQEIPTIEEYLIASKSKIGLFIELKGSSADEKMVDDIVKLVKEKNMEKEIAILSLDYNLIKYTEEKYPEIDTGYLYFFSIGDTKNLVADILIMEEREASAEKIENIHKVGKKAIVWTVNSEESIQKFVNSDVDGIITDDVVKVKEGIKNMEERNDIQIIIDSIMN